MLPATVIPALLPTIIALPWTKRLEAACKEASKKIEKRAKSLPRAKFTEKIVEETICAEIGKLGKDLTKNLQTVVKKNVEKEKKKAEAVIKKDPAKAQKLKLTGLRDDLEKAKKATVVEPEKPLKLPKPKGAALYKEIKIKVLTKDKVELDIPIFIGVDPWKSIEKGKLQFFFGLGIGGKF